METEEKLSAYLLSSGKGPNSMRELLPRIKCVDGTSISVQASRTHYCSPRDDNGPWHQVECGYPTVAPSSALMDFAEDPDRPTDTVYGYVPLGIVAAFLDEHGGIEEPTS